jgi:acetyl-CoA C-acetyltransferase
MTGGVFIVAAKRTPIGAFCGAFCDTSAVDLGAGSLKGAAESVGLCENGELMLESNLVAFFGCALQAGIGQNPCRQVIAKAGLSAKTTAAITINQVCCSGMAAIGLACNAINSGETDVAIAGGMENMSQAPYLLDNERLGYRKWHGELLDHMRHDGLEDAICGETMTSLAEKTAKKHELSREEVDQSLINSFGDIKNSIEAGCFYEELVQIRTGPNDDSVINKSDEVIKKVILEKMLKLSPVINGGILTPATISALADGAASTILMSERSVKTTGVVPLVRVAGCEYSRVEPENFIEATIFATRSLCKKLGWKLSDVSLFEVNEAFSIVPLIFSKELDIDIKNVNVSGGACILGHPIGCSGARIVVTLAHNMIRLQKTRAVAAICAGGGDGIAIALELCT